MTEMSPAEAIYFAALARTPEQRAAYLDEACAGDAELRRRVERMLDVQPRIGGFLQEPAGAIATVDEPPVGERPGAAIGPYKLVEPIGEGGMGAVWMAQQTEPVKRLVALKLIKPGMDSKQVVARFEAERQALALMEHPNIARVLDGGTTPAGRPYFVMDLVKGVPITRYCDDHHLTPRQRLELFLPVCQAVQHAHQKGIIHRDLKPSNVLVALYDGKPVPKVIDFGVAKAAGPSLTDKTLVTGFGAIVGTLEYMSPEQAEVNQLDIDTRSDIYSLGVLLYELLTGSPPFSKKELAAAGVLEMLRVIREQEPSKPSTKLSTAEGLPTLAANRGTEPAKLTKLVRGELDWIVMKALEKDRSRRYETANGFAMDVQRYLADEPVLACPPSAVYRLRKFTRRNKAALATVAIILAAIIGVAGSVGWVVKDRQAQQSMTRREVETALAEATRLLGESRWAEALAWVNRAEGVLAHGGGDEDLRRRVRDLRADLEMVETLEEVRLQGAEVKVEEDRFELERTDPIYEKTFRDYGIDVVALDPAEAAERIQARNVPVELAAALDDWAEAILWTGESGRPRANHLLAVARLADPDPWRSRLRVAAERSDKKALQAMADSAEVRNLRPASVRMLASYLPGEQALPLLRQALERQPGDFWINQSLGQRLRRAEQWGEAARFDTVAVALRPRSPGVHLNVGISLDRSGRPKEAIAALREAIRLKPDYAAAHHGLGNVLGRNPRFDMVLGRNPRLGEAIAAIREAIRLRPNYAAAHQGLGVVLLKKRLPDEAIAAFREAIRLDPDEAYARHGLGQALLFKGQVDEALAEYTRAIELKPNDGALRSDRAQLYDGRNQWDKAIADWTEAVKLKPGSYETQLAWLLVTCPDPKFRDAARAVGLAGKAVESRPKYTHAWLTLGVAHYRAGDWKAAIAALHKPMELYPGSPYEWFFLAMAHWKQGNKDEARQWYDKSIEWMDKYGSSNLHHQRFRAEAAELLGVKVKKDQESEKKP